MKIKIGQAWGSDIDRDLARVHQLRHQSPDGTRLMVDANGGYSTGQARRVGAILDDLGVTWFEEPVAAAVANLRHPEWFADHARLEPLVVDGVPAVLDGALHPDNTATGHGMTISIQAEQWCAT